MERAAPSPNDTAHPARRCNLPVVAPPYEKLHAWRECHVLALSVYKATKRFPSDERYGLTSQLRRAAFSSAVNIVEGSIVEGSSRKGRKEFRRFLDISLSSLTEVGYALRFAKEAGLLEEGVWRDLNDRQNRARFLTWQLYRALGGGGPPPTSTNPRPSSTIT